MNVTPLTAAASPITAAELRAYLRLNDSSEDTLLTELLVAAAERFEDETLRPVLTRNYRQFLERWNLKIILGRAGITAVTGVKQLLANGSTANVNYVADLNTAPNHVRIDAYPVVIFSAAGIPISPVGYIDFTAGWANTAAVPKGVLVAMKSLAGHWYENREAFTERSLGALEQGWDRLITQYKLGIREGW